jgi:tetratricopeptide (TPR) repeat protein/SH3-like domain-containing protein
MKKRMLAALLLLALLVSIGSVGAQANGLDCDSSTEEEFVDRGDFKFYEHDWEGAIQEYTCALELNPENTTALFNRGYSYYEIGEFTESEADYNSYLEIDGDNPAALNNIANIYFSRGDYDAALDLYNRSLELEPNDPVPMYNRASLKFELGNYEAALEDAERGYRLDPNYVEGRLSRARIYQALGDPRYHQDYAAWVNYIREQTEELPGEPVTDLRLDIVEGMVFEVPLEVAAGQIIQAAARTNPDIWLDTLLVLEDSEGNPVASDDDSGVNLDAVLKYEVPEDGRYTLLVTHSNGGENGELLLTLSIAGEAVTGAAAEAFIDYGLVIQDTAVVYTTEGDRLNLRSGPGLNFEITAKLERDSRVTLLEGPKKADGYAWWRVQTADGTIGWAVERVEAEQTLQQSILVGHPAVITSTEGDLVRVREGAGRGFSIVVQLEPGTIVDVLDGPVIADDLSWWKVRTADGTEGWAVERVADDRTLARYQVDEA